MLPTSKDRKKDPVLAIVLPCYNEGEALSATITRMLAILDDMSGRNLISDGSYMLLCDDGSTDNTWQIISQAHRDSPQRIKGLRLGHNRGQQNALMGALMTVKDKCDVAVSMDADLQDPPEIVEKMLGEYAAGMEIVYGVRTDRSSDSWFKRTSAGLFYRFQHWLGLDTITNHADFRLMSAKALEHLADYKESNLFLRGIIPQLGLDSSAIGYTRPPRREGRSKYPLKRMLGLGVDGITSFSARPMRIIFLVGMALLLADIAVAVYVLLSYFGGVAISGWSSLMLSVWFLGSLILMALGVVGEYVGKIFVEVKHRPRYKESERLW